MQRRSLFSICRNLCLFAALTASSANATMPNACVTPHLLLPDGVERQVEGLVGDTHCYRLELPAAGVWHLSITSSTPIASRARFEVLDTAGRRASLDTLERTAAERLTLVPAGTWWVHVRSEDPRRPLPAYRLASRFVKSAMNEMAWKSEEDGELEIESEGLVAGGCGMGVFKSEEDGELEIESEGLVAGGCGMSFFKSEEDGELEIESEGLVAGGCGMGVFKSEEDGELEIESEGLVAGCDAMGLFKSEEDGELEIESEGLVAGCGDRAAEIRQDLCHTDDADDHGDSLACATTMRCQTRGELTGSWGDDVDVFRFTIDRWQTVEIATCGGFGIHGELSGGDGRRLEIASGNDGDFRMVRTLGPGTYFVKVSGESVGSYGLAMRALDR